MDPIYNKENIRQASQVTSVKLVSYTDEIFLENLAIVFL